MSFPRCRLSNQHWPALQAFPFGFGAKKDRGRGFSVLTAREMKLEPKNERGGGRGEGRKETHPLPALLLPPFFARSLTLVPRSLFINRTETLATRAKL